MRTAIRRPLSSALAAVGGVLTVVAGLAVIDERVRSQIASLATARRVPTGEIQSAGTYLRDVALIVFEAIRDRSIDHAPQVIFSVAAVTLVIFMVRTRI